MSYLPCPCLYLPFCTVQMSRIQRDNELLAKRIDTIRTSEYNKPPKKTASGATLNAQTRRRGLLEIMEANSRILERIVGQKSVLDRSEWQKHAAIHEARLARMAGGTVCPIRDASIKHPIAPARLPPIKYDNDNTNRSTHQDTDDLAPIPNTSSRALVPMSQEKQHSSPSKQRTDQLGSSKGMNEQRGNSSHRGGKDGVKKVKQAEPGEIYREVKVFKNGMKARIIVCMVEQEGDNNGTNGSSSTSTNSTSNSNSTEKKDNSTSSSSTSSSSNAVFVLSTTDPATKHTAKITLPYDTAAGLYNDQVHSTGIFKRGMYTVPSI